ncbi:MAG: enoyl-CoA hydratase/isomerase family protein, partial [Pseudomonadota bacterium]
IIDQLHAWAEDASITCVLIEGAGDRAFCAGGDIVAVARAMQVKDASAAHYFAAEYTVDHVIHRFPKPYVALMDGITMGGGCGLSVHGSHRVVTDRTMLAMPEVGIGFFCDVGATLFLNRCPGTVGLYMALTAARIDGAEAHWAGLGTHYVASSRMAELKSALIEAGDPDEALAGFAQAPPPAALAGMQAIIDRCFGHPTVEAIVAALNRESDPAAREMAESMAKQSPTSLKLTHHLMTRNTSPSIEESLIWDYRASQGCVAGHDFYEGIRALLIDKDGAPKWQPDRLAGVSQEMIEEHLQIPDGGDLPLSN